MGRRTVRVGHETGEQPGGGAAVAEQPVRRPRGRERLVLLRLRHADLAGAAVGPLERAAAAVRAAAGLAGGEAGGLGGVESADGRRGGVVAAAAGDGLRDGRQERPRRGAVPRQLPRPRRRHPPVVRRRQAVHRRCLAAAAARARLGGGDRSRGA